MQGLGGTYKVWGWQPCVITAGSGLSSGRCYRQARMEVRAVYGGLTDTRETDEQLWVQKWAGPLV
jgi:hypothetical protein